jgi:hypothetical protein
MKMKLSNNYIFTNDDLQRIISEWSQANDFSQKALDYVNGLNMELKKAIDSKNPLSEPSIACMSGFKRINRAMNPFITFLPAYLKDVDSKTIPITISAEELDTLRSIYDEVKLWQKEYNGAVQKYKSYQQIYELR